MAIFLQSLHTVNTILTITILYMIKYTNFLYLEASNVSFTYKLFRDSVSLDCCLCMQNENHQ